MRSGRGRRIAAISWNGAREEERRSVPVVLMRCAVAMNKREVGSPPMRNCMGGRPCNPGGQNVLEKKRLHPKMEPYESGANGRGRRKRRLPLDLTEGGGFGFDPCRCLRDRGRRCGAASHRQDGICGTGTVPAMRQCVCQPCTERGECQGA